MKLWIFGDSLSLPYNITQESNGWPSILSAKLNCQYVSFAKPAVDNFYIYSCYLHALPNIGHNDIVVVGWTHPSRKSFVFDETNPVHVSALNDSYVFEAGNKFIRSKNVLNDTLSKWEKLLPLPRNKPFYDQWFQNYYSLAEQKTNLFSYYSSVLATCPGHYISFFFSKESIECLDIKHHAGTMLEFIKHNNCSISPQDAHLNESGHSMWADHMFDHVKNCQRKTVFPMIELIDRHTIAKLKFAKTGDNLEEIEFYNNQLKYYNLDLVDDEINQLYQVHVRIWELEAELKSGKENNLSLDQIGSRAIAIRNQNNQRIKLKNKIAEKFGDCVREIKKDHLSQ